MVQWFKYGAIRQHESMAARAAVKGVTTMITGGQTSPGTTRQPARSSKRFDALRSAVPSGSYGVFRVPSCSSAVPFNQLEHAEQQPTITGEVVVRPSQRPADHRTRTLRGD